MEKILKKILLILSGFFLIFLIFSISYFLQRTEKANTVVIGSKNFTEQNIVGEIISQIIENNTDLKVKRQFNLEGTMISFQALRSGDVDVYTEYTGTGIVDILKAPIISDPQKAYDFVKKEFKEKFDLIWLQPFGFNNTFAMIMRKDQAKELDLETISDLAIYLKNHSLISAFDPEVLSRPEYKQLLCLYNLKFNPRPFSMDQSLIYFSLANESIDVSLGFTTDSRIEIYHLAMLIDNLHVFPSYFAAPLVRGATLEKHPNLKKVLNMLGGKISDDEMQRLNYEVDEEKQRIEIVARKFLLSKGLIQRS